MLWILACTGIENQENLPTPYSQAPNAYYIHHVITHASIVIVATSSISNTSLHMCKGHVLLFKTKKLVKQKTHELIYIYTQGKKWVVVCLRGRIANLSTSSFDLYMCNNLLSSNLVWHFFSSLVHFLCRRWTPNHCTIPYTNIKLKPKREKKNIYMSTKLL